MKVLRGKYILVHVRATLPYCSQHDIVRIMPLYPLFPQISPYLCKTSCPRHDVKLHNYASQLLRQHVARAYGQDTPVLVIICKLKVLTSRPFVAS